MLSDVAPCSLDHFPFSHAIHVLLFVAAVEALYVPREHNSH